MKFLAVLAAVFLTVSASTDKAQWQAFKQSHGKTYKSLLEERTRFGIFQNNLRTIEEHNARYEQGQETYYLAVTQFSDMTSEEFKEMLAFQYGTAPDFNATLHEFPENLEAPDSIDWTQKGAVLGVKNQGQCGSCWAFSTTGAIEGQNAILHGVKTSLSEQQLLDCSQSYGNGNCNVGGHYFNAFSYIKDKGIEPESTYPYVGKVTTCRYSAQKTVLKLKGYKQLGANENALKNGVGTVGPISVAIYAEPIQQYGGGIFTGRCNGQVDHAVLAVGYGTEGGKKFWKVKNSWGGSWGESGYFRIARDSNNLCHIAQQTAYPLL